MARADNLAVIRGTASATLMENAGYAVADDIVARHQQGTRVAVVCGPGNNGGDGFVVARVLAGRGFVVRVGLLGDVANLVGDAAEAAARWRRTVERAEPAILDRADVIVDALFGAGLSKPVDGPAAVMVEAINAARTSGAAVVSIDLPSGIDGRTGAVLGTAVRADRSVTFFRRKPGHLLLPGRSHAGRVIVADIGIPENVLDDIRPAAMANGPALWRSAWPVPGRSPQIQPRRHPRRLRTGGGLRGRPARRRRGLARRVRHRHGRGAPAAVPTVAAYRAAFVVRPADTPEAFKALAGEPRLRSIVVGPGLGVSPETREILGIALETACGIVLDADALTVAAGDRAAVFAGIAERTGATVMTPTKASSNGSFPMPPAPSWTAPVRRRPRAAR